jgi:hypothetical protein
MDFFLGVQHGGTVESGCASGRAGADLRVRLIWLAAPTGACSRLLNGLKANLFKAVLHHLKSYV